MRYFLGLVIGGILGSLVGFIFPDKKKLDESFEKAQRDNQNK